MRVGAEQARQPGDPLGKDRVALVRHGAAALLAGAERLERLANLGALEVPDLDRDALERAAQDRERREQLGVPVAADHLGRRGVGLQPEAIEDVRLHLGAHVGVRADRARDRADRRCPRARAPAAPRPAPSSAYQPAALKPNVIGSAWMPWLRPTIGVSRCWSARRWTTSSSRASSPSTTARRIAQHDGAWPCRGRPSW